jgi:hypothetical protein
MPAREIEYRLGERLRLEAERVQVSLRAARILPSAPQLLDDWSSSAARLEDIYASRFYLSPSDREALRQFVDSEHPEWRAKAVAEAEAICEHKVELLGHGILDLGTEFDWHRDPVARSAWPIQFWADYDPVDDPRFGDVKNIHELNRHQHLPRLAKAYFLTGEERYACEAVTQIESWILQNPEGMGINWQSSLEIAIRVISWLWTIFFLLPAREFSESFARRVCESLFAQLRHVYSYPSLYSSPNTHLIGEAAALFIGGSLFEGMAEAEKWRDEGAKLLAEQIGRQILSDGVHAELSTYYHCYAIDFFLQALILARRNHFPFPAELSDKVKQMLEFLMRIEMPSGRIPLLGDDDGGRALALDRQHYRSYADGLCIGAMFFRRPDFKRQAGPFCEEALWLFGREAWFSYKALASEVPTEDADSFLEAGYFVQRSGWDPDASYLLFDCGGLGAPTGGHGHADALSVVLSAGGREILTDSGTCVYNGASEWRNLFRSTRAHNTVVVDGRDQSEPGGTFQWQTQAPVRFRRHSVLDGLQYIEGEHHGYAPLVHKRRVLYCKPGYWIVVDELQGSGEHRFDFLYHFAPDFGVSVLSGADHSAQAYADSNECDHGLLLFLTGTKSLGAEVTKGWTSSRYGSMQAASVLCATANCVAPLLAATVLAPVNLYDRDKVVPSIRRETVPGCALSLSVTAGDQVDLLMLPESGKEIEVGGMSLCGELFWLRKSGDTPERVLSVGAGRTEIYVRSLRDLEVRCG